MKRPSAQELFYDPWNAGLFKKMATTNRKAKNSSANRLIKNFIRRQREDN